MNHWNYRVIYDPESESFSIHEVYYENNKPTMWTENPVSIVGDDLNQLSNSFSWMQKAFSKPILKVLDGKLVEETRHNLEASKNGNSNSF